MLIVKQNVSIGVKISKILKLKSKKRPVDHDKKQASELQIHCILVTILLLGKDTMTSKTLVKSLISTCL